MTRPLVAVVGPTCSGKTSLAVRLAELWAPAELINADSRQVLRGLQVGTCAPTAVDLRGVRCHLLELVEPGEPFTVADWVIHAHRALAEIENRGARALVVGGTGLYVTALMEGFDFGDAPPDAGHRARRSVAATAPDGLRALADELRRRDPAAAERIDLRNPRRLLRALEILDAHGDGPAPTPGRHDPVPALLIGLNPPRDLHEVWVRQRSASLFDEGRLLDEVSHERASGRRDAVLDACGIGYREAIEVLDGRASVAEAVAATVRRTLRYAKAQRTFWRRETRVEWHNPADLSVEDLAQDLRERLDQHALAYLRRPQNKRLRNGGFRATLRSPARPGGNEAHARSDQPAPTSDS
jgi:tRNA dimethylallyltransferase